MPTYRTLPTFLSSYTHLSHFDWSTSTHLAHLRGITTVPEQNLLTRAQLAERLSCHARTVDKLTRDGMPSVRVGARPRYDYDRVLAWLTANAVSAVREAKK